MHSDKFELAFSTFLEGEEYDQASASLFAIARLAFEAGWRAAEAGRRQGGGEVLQLLPK